MEWLRQGGTGPSREESWQSPSVQAFPEASHHQGATYAPLSLGCGCKAHGLWLLKLSPLQDGRREGGQAAWIQPLFIIHTPYSSPSCSVQFRGF